MNFNNFFSDKSSNLFFIIGNCVVESEQLTIEVASNLKNISKDIGVKLIFKSSFDKANRLSTKNFRGLNFDKSLKILSKIKSILNIPLITDVHEYTPISEVASVVDILQIPAFLCRQTDFLRNIVSYGLPTNIKKGQFLSPYNIKNIMDKILELNNKKIFICERGFSFGYNNLISDIRSLVIMKEYGFPIIFDATHSVQLPGGKGNSSDGQSFFIPYLSYAAITVGIAGIFMETHPNPNLAMSDGANSWPLYQIKQLMINLKNLDLYIKNKLKKNVN